MTWSASQGAPGSTTPVAPSPAAARASSTIPTRGASRASGWPVSAGWGGARPQVGDRRPEVLEGVGDHDPSAQGARQPPGDAGGGHGVAGSIDAADDGRLAAAAYRPLRVVRRNHHERDRAPSGELPRHAAEQPRAQRRVTPGAHDEQRGALVGRGGDQRVRGRVRGQQAHLGALGAGTLADRREPLRLVAGAVGDVAHDQILPQPVGEPARQGDDGDRGVQALTPQRITPRAYALYGGGRHGGRRKTAARQLARAREPQAAPVDPGRPPGTRLARSSELVHAVVLGRFREEHGRHGP